MFAANIHWLPTVWNSRFELHVGPGFSAKTFLDPASHSTLNYGAEQVPTFAGKRRPCDLLRLIFNECGAIVQTSATAADALRVFDEWRPDILVSDIGMPGTDGYELIRAIRKDRGSRIPAVALTAMARIEDRIKALSRGYQLHVPKPVEPAELISIVSSLVDLVDHRSRE